MAGFSLHIDLSAMEAQMKALQGGMRDLTPAMKAFGEFMIMRTQERFSGEHDPQGRKWAPLSAVSYAGAFARWGTRKKFTKKGAVNAKFRKFILAKKILTTSGILRKSITYKAGSDELSIGTNMMYARIHQLGGKAGRGHKVTIPARPFLGFNAEDIAEAVATIKDFLRLDA